MDWFLYDNGLRHERVKNDSLKNYWGWFLQGKIVLAELLRITRLRSELCNSYKMETVYGNVKFNKPQSKADSLSP